MRRTHTVVTIAVLGDSEVSLPVCGDPVQFIREDAKCLIVGRIDHSRRLMIVETMLSPEDPVCLRRQRWNLRYPVAMLGRRSLTRRTGPRLAIKSWAKPGRGYGLERNTRRSIPYSLTSR